jgi:hypothetical protein
MSINDALRLRHDQLFLTFLKIEWAIGQGVSRVRRENRCSPALSHSANLNAIASILNRGFVVGFGREVHWHLLSPADVARPTLLDQRYGMERALSHQLYPAFQPANLCADRIEPAFTILQTINETLGCKSPQE